MYNSYVTGSINAIGKGYMPVGGICGGTKGSANIENCYNLASIECKNINETQYNGNITCGGIAGQISAENSDDNEVVNIENCFNRRNINANGGNTLVLVGGIVGADAENSVNSNINNFYNNAKIQGSTSSNMNRGVGGITGGIANNATNASINNAYNTGSIEAEGLSSSQVGSISGSNLITLSNCFYLKGTYSIGVAGSGTVTGVIEWDSIDKFPSVLSVVNEDEVFKEDTNNINNGYPILDYQ